MNSPGRAELKRYERLAAKGVGSIEDKTKAEAQLDEARAAVAKDKANIASAELNLEYAHITAPFHGYIQDTLVHEGSQVTEEHTIMTTLVQTDPIHVVFSISRSQLAVIQQLQSEGIAPERWVNRKTILLGSGTGLWLNARGEATNDAQQHPRSSMHKAEARRQWSQ